MRQIVYYPPGSNIPAAGIFEQGEGGYAVASIPVINTPASIPGTPMVGLPITAIDATWNNGVTSVAYEWKVAGVVATGTGEMTLTYTPAGGDAGKTLTITVTAWNAGGTSIPSTSAASAAVVGSSNSTQYVVLLAA